MNSITSRVGRNRAATPRSGLLQDQCDRHQRQCERREQPADRSVIRAVPKIPGDRQNEPDLHQLRRFKTDRAEIHPRVNAFDLPDEWHREPDGGGDGIGDQR